MYQLISPQCRSRKGFFCIGVVFIWYCSPCLLEVSEYRANFLKKVTFSVRDTEKMKKISKKYLLLRQCHSWIGQLAWIFAWSGGQNLLPHIDFSLAQHILVAKKFRFRKVRKMNESPVFRDLWRHRWSWWVIPSKIRLRTQWILWVTTYDS